MLGAGARECIVNWRIRGQYRYCDKSEEKAVNRSQLSYFRAPVRFTDIVLCGEHFNTSRTKTRNGLTVSRPDVPLIDILEAQLEAGNPNSAGGKCRRFRP